MSTSKVGGGFNGDVDVELVMLITCVGVKVGFSHQQSRGLSEKSARAGVLDFLSHEHTSLVN